MAAGPPDDIALPVDRRALPAALQSAEVDASRRSPAEVEIRFASDALVAGCWARAFDGDGTLVAMAPVDSAAVVLLVAPETVGDVEVDVTDMPAVRRPSRLLDIIDAAIAAGRQAASAERAGRAKAAAVAWRRSAALWREANDDTRASIADDYASAAFGRSRSERIPPALLADKIDA